MFTQQTLDFLFENRLKDSRTWFAEHRNQYLSDVKKPLYEFAERMAPELARIDPDIVTLPQKVVSRINRDIRFSKDKSLYRDNMWCTFGRDKKRYPNDPAFFFEFYPGYYRYGCGYYWASPGLMEILRGMVLQERPAFSAACEALVPQGIFTLEGECYKRNRYPDQPGELAQWLNRKDIYCVRNEPDISGLFSEGLVRQVAEGFHSLVPFYHFLRDASDRFASSRSAGN